MAMKNAHALLSPYWLPNYSSVPEYSIAQAGVGHAYLNARYYNPAQGQFLSQDPVFWEIAQTEDGLSALQDPQLQNSYSYSSNNPINKKDPEGRISQFFFSPVVVNFLRGLLIGADAAFTINGTAQTIQSGSHNFSSDKPLDEAVFRTLSEGILNVGSGALPSRIESVGADIIFMTKGSANTPQYSNQKNYVNYIQKYTNSYQTPSFNFSSSFQSLNNSGFSAGQSSAAAGVAQSFGFSSLNSSQVQAIQSVKEAFSNGSE